MPSKIFCRILLKRIETVIDSTLREEQAGFRRGRGCMDQIFAFRNILEQSLELNISLCINFIDFQKAFDSVHRESLWKILQTYGLPPKIINLIKMFYDNFECSIILRNNNINKNKQNTLFHPMVITIFIQIKIQIHVDGVLAARNNLKVKNARQPVRRKDI